MYGSSCDFAQNTCGWQIFVLEFDREKGDGICIVMTVESDIVNAMISVF